MAGAVAVSNDEHSGGEGVVQQRLRADAPVSLQLQHPLHQVDEEQRVPVLSLLCAATGRRSRATGQRWTPRCGQREGLMKRQQRDPMEPIPGPPGNGPVVRFQANDPTIMLTL